ncbi:unnamed protein product [Anisakis simplex]|uniref:Uncharacterized protein n=1 Tax=Anisakis simplex TaxID=6269 RepID=A0A0M3K6M3_ANISI|nr:unnamed protein product [Anisakis simplex]
MFVFKKEYGIDSGASNKFSGDFRANVEKRKAEKALQKLQQLEKLQLSGIQENIADEDAQSANIITQRQRKPLRDVTISPKVGSSSVGGINQLADNFDEHLLISEADMMTMMMLQKNHEDSQESSQQHRLQQTSNNRSLDSENSSRSFRSFQQQHSHQQQPIVASTPKSNNCTQASPSSNSDQLILSAQRNSSAFTSSDSEEEFFDAASEISSDEADDSQPYQAHHSLNTASALDESRSGEKVRSPRLNALAECTEPPLSNLEYQSVSTSPRDDRSVPKNVSPRVSKAHSTTNPDLRDIEQIVEMQENALREELMQIQRKVSSQSDRSNSSLTPSRPRNVPSVEKPSPAQHKLSNQAAMISSSRSVDFANDSTNIQCASVQQSKIFLFIFCFQRLPTPLRRPSGARSMIPTPTSRMAVPKIAVRGFGGGSTPSLLPPNSSGRSKSDETQSECGPSEWADECF